MRKKLLLLLGLGVLLIPVAVAFANTTLVSHTGETGATWAEHTNFTAGGFEVVSGTGAVRSSVGGTTGIDYASGAPASANYTVEADIIQKSAATNAYLGVVGRLSTAATTYYDCVYYQPSGAWLFQKNVAGTPTTLATTTQTLTSNVTYHVKLSMNGTAISCAVDGNAAGSATDSSVTAAGKAGILGRPESSPSDSAGYQLDNFVATDL